MLTLESLHPWNHPQCACNHAHKPPSDCVIPFGRPLSPLSMPLAHPTHEVFSASTPNKIDESKDSWIGTIHEFRVTYVSACACPSVSLCMSLRVYRPPCVCPVRVHVPPCACSFRRVYVPFIYVHVCPLRVWVPSYDCSFTHMFPQCV